MASIRQHGKGFQVRFYNYGVRQCETYRTLEDAQIRSKEIEILQLKQISVESRPHNIKFVELAAAVVRHYEITGLKSRDDIEARFRIHLVPFFGQRKAVTITGAHIEAYMGWRQSKGASNGTINREIEAMRRAYKLGIEQGAFMPAMLPHFPHLRESNARAGFFTREEVDRLCSHLKDPLNRFVKFAFLTAWRLEEIRNLRWSNVDFDKGEIRLDPGTTKNDSGRVFPMTAELRAVVGVQPRRLIKNSPFVFTIRNGKVGEFRKTWARALMKAGFPCTVETKKVLAKQGPNKGKKVTRITRVVAHHVFHDLRRSGVREFIRAGMPDKTAMLLSGHKTRSVLDRYNIISSSDLLEARRYLEPTTPGVGVVRDAGKVIEFPAIEKNG